MDLHQINPLEMLSGDPVLSPYAPALTEAVQARHRSIFERDKKGINLARAVGALPGVRPSSIEIDEDRIRIGSAHDLEKSQYNSLLAGLKALKPWRKGPFEVFGIDLDCEWNSAIKWNRLADHLGDQTGKRVLDIGSSCGYYLFRMAARKPAVMIGIEPYLTFYLQYLALAGYLGLPNVCCLPLKLEEMPAMRRCFDTVLCMGILYHRRSPLDTLLSIHKMMAPGGLLALETLIIEGDSETALFPEKRYAQMGNIFFIPTVNCLTHWLARCGFGEIRCVDISKTTPEEQRRTDWIDTLSLSDFLDPNDPSKTVEGYPAPVRAMAVATALPR